MSIRRLAFVLAVAVVAAVAPATSAGATTVPGWPVLRAQFDYAPQPIGVRTFHTNRLSGVIVRSITYRAPGHDPVRAYLVTPTSVGPHPAVMFLHWLDGPTDSNRGEFLHEAISLAEGPRHVVSLLPQLTFPFSYGPVGDVRDKDAVVKQVVQLRRGLDLLDARSDVDPNRVAVVGHDYGAMYGAIVAAVDRDRVRADVILAADATMANWFVTYFLDLPAEQVAPYEQMLAGVDPIRYLGHAPRQVLLQYATEDIYIPHGVAERMHRAAGPSATFLTYDTGHALQVPAAQIDRDSFVERALNP
jgi:pimeloyl-ACP methyl ester carboxylesterase